MTAESESEYGPPTALLNPNWWAWNERVWGIRVVELRLEEDRSARGVLSGAIFKDRRGRIVSPPLNPHLPVAYTAPERRTLRPDSQSRMWVSIGGQLSDVMMEAGLANQVVLPPGLMDARPFTWNSLRAGLSYTFLVDLPRDATLGNPSVGKNIRKAAGRGYKAERSDDWQAIWSCLAETEASKGFSHRLTLADLRLAARLMGADCFRGYVVRDSAGHVVSGGVRLHSPGHRALDWVQGTIRQALADGVNQLMYDFVMRDLHEAGAAGFDLAGANIREVAVAKSSWGYPLVPQLSLEPRGVLREIRRSMAGNAAARRAVSRGREMAVAIVQRRATRGGEPT